MTYLDNRTILEKADLALADLTAGGGILSLIRFSGQLVEVATSSSS